MWQPKKIVKCKIKGNICLIQCGPTRIHNNWTQYMNSLTPEHWDGGGGWSQLKFSLSSLWEQRQLVRNIWTRSNVALPLVRYNGCKFKFYRTQDVDYIVHYNNCLPMLDTEMQHTNAQPLAMMMYHKKVIVPSMKTLPLKRKPFIKKFIKPPPQLETKWYFQQDLCNTGLVMLTTTAVDLNRFYLNPKAQSNSITLTCLNTKFFTNRNFQQTDLETAQYYWGPKPSTWLFALRQGAQFETAKIQDLIPLMQTQRYSEGLSLAEIKNKQPTYSYIRYANQIQWFGNPFFSLYLHDDIDVYIMTGTTDPNNFFQQNWNNMANTVIPKDKFTKLTQPLLIDVRYTPNKDTGIGNEVYYLKNTRNENNWDAPTDPKLSLTGFPLWLTLWGYDDWHYKVHYMQQIDLNYILVIKTEFFDQKLPGYVILDKPFITGHSPYSTEGPPDASDFAHWLPKYKYQKVSVDNICKTGPATIKTGTTSIEAHCYYCFYFKWGGCPNQLENIADPCEQPKYSVPSNMLQTTEIENPNTSPTKQLYPFDFRRHIITAKAAERIKKDSTSETNIFTDATVWDPQPQQETTSEEETETSPQEEITERSLDLLKQQQRQLQHRIFKLMKHTPTLKFTNLK